MEYSGAPFAPERAVFRSPNSGALGRVATFTGGGVAGAGVVAFARHRLGGFTGDVLGAAGIVGETVGLLVAAARW